MVDIPDDYIWIVVVGFIVSFILALGTGANDVANTFGTSVGAKVLTLRQACILAAIFETAGAVLLGAKVSETVRKGIIDIDLYQNETSTLLVGNVATLSGSCVWLIVATFFNMPVSATHSIVGATMGFSLVAKGAAGINWVQLGLIIASWFISPVLSGIVSTAIFYLSKMFILDKADPLEPGIRFLPIFYAVTIAINVFSIFYDGPEMLNFDRIPLWATFILACGTAVVMAFFVRFLLAPWQRRKIIEEVADQMETDLPKKDAEKTESGESKSKETEEEFSTKNGIISTIEIHRESVPTIQKHGVVTMTSPEGIVEFQLPDEDDKAEEKEDTVDRNTSREAIKDKPEQAKLFSFLQILTAIFGAFAHGGNDVSNAIGPLISIWLVATSDTVITEAPTPIWILFYGGVGISVGLAIWGRRVIKTLGEDLTKVTPSSGFCIEIGAALTVLIASNLGLPISSTHCKVGSIVFVGRFRSKENVDWSLFRNIIGAWIFTLPATIGASAAFMALLQLAI